MRAFAFDPQVVRSLNKVLHEPARLTLVACLAALEEADFVFLQSQTGMTVGNLSSHVRKLEEAGYVAVRKEFQDNRPRTTLALTAEGRDAFQTYLAQLRAFLEAVAGDAG